MQYYLRMEDYVKLKEESVEGIVISGEEEAIKLDKKKPKKKQIKEQKEEKVEQASDEKYTVSSAEGD